MVLEQQKCSIVFGLSTGADAVLFIGRVLATGGGVNGIDVHVFLGLIDEWTNTRLWGVTWL